jgi:hypothetical protein
MKRLILTLLIFAITLRSYCQLNISTDTRSVYVWDTQKNDFVLTVSEDLSTLLEFNKEFTMFKHTTKNITSTYYIKGDAFNKEVKAREFNIVSDVGNKYILFIKTNENKIVFLGNYDDGTPYYIDMHIKRLWFD